MKKYTCILLLLLVFSTSFGQTILNQFPLELKKSSDYFQILNGENQQKDYFSFVTDKKKCTLLKYNSVLFFKDSLSIERPNNDYDFMAGMTFSRARNPQVYWVSKDFQKIRIVDFDLEKHVSTSLDYENDFKREKVIDVFTVENSFLIVSITNENKLKFTHFSNTGKNENTIDLGTKNTKNGNSIDNSLVSNLFDFGLTKIEAELFTPLYVASAKVKRYLQDKNYILSFDVKDQTSLITINLTDFSFIKEQFPYENLEKSSGSNSFLQNNILYQLTANSEALALSAIDLNSKKIVQTYRVGSTESITFKNSPLFVQNASGKIREFKNTANFLSKIDYNNLGLSIYATPNYNLFTIGGVREVASAGNIALGVGLTLGGIIGGVGIDSSSMIENGNLQSLYFESYFDNNFEHSNKPFSPLYIDSLGEFLSKTNPEVQNLYPFKNYVILNYYDSKSKEFVMRKFQDNTY